MSIRMINSDPIINPSLIFLTTSEMDWIADTHLFLPTVKTTINELLTTHLTEIKGDS